MEKVYTTQTLEYHYIDNDYVMRFSSFNYTTSLWLESNLFGDNLNAKIGADMNYFTSYYAKAYNPALAKLSFQEESTYW